MTLIEKEKSIGHMIIAGMIKVGYSADTACIAANAAVRALQGRALRPESWEEMRAECMRDGLGSCVHCDVRRPDR